jgi:hypothetical protein
MDQQREGGYWRPNPATIEGNFELFETVLAVRRKPQERDESQHLWREKRRHQVERPDPKPKTGRRINIEMPPTCLECSFGVEQGLIPYYRNDSDCQRLYSCFQSPPTDTPWWWWWWRVGGGQMSVALLPR